MKTNITLLSNIGTGPSSHTTVSTTDAFSSVGVSYSKTTMTLTLGNHIAIEMEVQEADKVIRQLERAIDTLCKEAIAECIKPSGIAGINGFAGRCI